MWFEMYKEDLKRQILEILRDEFFRMKKFGSLNDAINQGYESFCEYSNEMLSGFGRHELTIREYEAILLAQEMYARGAEFVME